MGQVTITIPSFDDFSDADPELYEVEVLKRIVDAGWTQREVSRLPNALDFDGPNEWLEVLKERLGCIFKYEEAQQ